jgi:hypothetical protein
VVQTGGGLGGYRWGVRRKAELIKAEGRRQKAEGKRQKAEGKRQKAEGPEASLKPM